MTGKGDINDLPKIYFQKTLMYSIQCQYPSKSGHLKLLNTYPLTVKYSWDIEKTCPVHLKIIPLVPKLTKINFFADESMLIDLDCLENLCCDNVENGRCHHLRNPRVLYQKKNKIYNQIFWCAEGVHFVSSRSHKAGEVFNLASLQGEDVILTNGKCLLL
jgi:hypothetical protein